MHLQKYSCPDIHVALIKSLAQNAQTPAAVLCASSLDRIAGTEWNLSRLLFTAPQTECPP